MKKTSIFQQYKEILENLEIGESISRKTLKEKLGLESHSYKTVDSSSIITLDSYRRAFELACFIKLDRASQRLGAYQKIKEIDPEICKSISSLKKENALFMSKIPKLEEFHFREMWEKSGLSAKDFIYKHRGLIAGKKFDL